VVSNGRYGPYVKCGDETRSLPVDVSPLTVSLETSLELLAQPKTRGGRRIAAKEPLRQFPDSPVTGQPIKLLDGRYGPYVTDGTTNASLPKGATPEELTVEQAIVLLAERASRGGTKRTTGRKKTTAKRAPRKTSPKKSS
jgi:DNA topoisomerase-1